jgi:hypothetical protein
MLAEVLARHPDIGFVSNLDSFLPKFNLKGRLNHLVTAAAGHLTQRDRWSASSRHLEKSIFHFGPSEGWNLLSRHVSPIIAHACRDLTADDVTPYIRRRFRTFFEERIRTQQKAVFMHKFTEWPRARFVHEVFPEAKFLHIIRDGRAVAASLVRQSWWFGYRGPWRWNFGPLPDKYQKEWEKYGRSFLVLAALEWKLLMDAFEEAKRELPATQWMDLRYEDFVDQPRHCVAQILHFADLSWSDKFEKAFARHQFRENKEGYLRDLSQAQIEQLDSVLASYLQARGYVVPAAAASKEQVALLENMQTDAGLPLARTWSP